MNLTRYELLFFFALFVIAFGVRYIGLNYSYPFLVNGDEDTLMTHVATMTEDQTLDSNFYARPDQILYLVYYPLLNLISYVRFGQNFAYGYSVAAYPLTFCARILIALLGSLLPIAAYMIGREYSKKAALAAGMLFAFFPLFVKHSHYVSPDVLITLFTLLILLFVLYYLRTEKIKWLYLATIFASINTVEKYTGLISCALIAFAIVWMQVKKYKGNRSQIFGNILKQGALFFGIYLLGIYLLAPNLFFNYGDTIAHLKFESRSTHLGSDGLNWFGNMGYYLTNYLKNSNIVVNLISLLGIYAVIRNKKFSLLSVFYGLLYFALLSIMALHWERWGLIMHITPLLLAAFGFGYLFDLAGNRKWLKWTTAVILGGCVFYSLAAALSLSINMSYMSTAVYSYKYCEENGIDRKRTIYEHFTPFSHNLMPGNFSFDSDFDSADYIILSSDMYDRYYAEPEKYPNQVAVYNSIRSKYKLIKEFSPTQPVSDVPLISWIDDVKYFAKELFNIPQPERYTGPVIQIYKVVH